MQQNKPIALGLFLASLFACLPLRAVDSRHALPEAEPIVNLAPINMDGIKHTFPTGFITKKMELHKQGIPSEFVTKKMELHRFFLPSELQTSKMELHRKVIPSEFTTARLELHRKLSFVIPPAIGKVPALSTHMAAKPNSNGLATPATTPTSTLQNNLDAIKSTEQPLISSQSTLKRPANNIARQRVGGNPQTP